MSKCLRSILYMANMFIGQLIKMLFFYEYDVYWSTNKIVFDLTDSLDNVSYKQLPDSSIAVKCFFFKYMFGDRTSCRKLRLSFFCLGSYVKVFMSQGN